ncbi:hypothetical protein Q3G72_031986 [Acer saccharum]|nr:hypothetical protein Q3G72_031986 [Acer saccharum]
MEGVGRFAVSLMDLPCIVESFKTYVDSALSVSDSAPDRHGLTSPMRDARKRRFRREPDQNLYVKTESYRKSNLFANDGIIVRMQLTLFHDSLWFKHEEDGDGNVRCASENAPPVIAPETGANDGEPEF